MLSKFHICSAFINRITSSPIQSLIIGNLCLTGVSSLKIQTLLASDTEQTLQHCEELFPLIVGVSLMPQADHPDLIFLIVPKSSFAATSLIGSN